MTGSEIIRLLITAAGSAVMVILVMRITGGIKARREAMSDTAADLLHRISGQLDALDRIRQDFDALAKPFATASTNLRNLSKSWDELERRKLKLGEGLEKLEGLPQAASERTK